jgi:hypothetical protein
MEQIEHVGGDKQASVAFCKSPPAGQPQRFHDRPARRAAKCQSDEKCCIQ